MTGLALRQSTALLDEDVSIPLPRGFKLASGDVLEDGEILARLQGAAGAPAVVVLGGISAGRKPAGDGGWWRDIVGEGAAIDLKRYQVLGLEFAPLNDQRVRITPDDQARLIEYALDALGIERLHAFVGASYGGMVGLAFAARAPSRLERLCVICAAHRPASLGGAWRGIQRRIVEFGLAHGDGDAGLALARQLAMTTYRSPEEFEHRFAPGVDAQGAGAADGYLIARGEAYPKVIPPKRWLSLSEAIDRHDVEPERVSVPTTLAACTSDQLVPLAEMQDLATRLPRLTGFHTLSSIYGHDAFLKEVDAVSAVVSAALESDA
ncbi:MAG: homoserine O-succinyltransferase [Hyphomonadaceae bacterium]|nr:homoserine O-succinyltransferase [Hyphomonadaceae bacterium]